MPYVVKLILCAALPAAISAGLLTSSISGGSGGLVAYSFAFFLAIATPAYGLILMLVFIPLNLFARARHLPTAARYLVSAGASVSTGILLSAGGALTDGARLSALLGIGAAGLIWTLIDLKWSFQDAIERERNSPELAAASASVTKGLKVGLVAAVCAVLAPLVIIGLLFALFGR